jgi:hypothetical protein
MNSQPSSLSPQPSIQLHIERLVLEGLSVSHAKGPIIRAAVEGELSRLLATEGLGLSFQSGGAWPSVPVSVIQLTASKPVQLGQQIARAVYGGIGLEQSLTSRTKEGGTHVSQK